MPGGGLRLTLRQGCFIIPVVCCRSAEAAARLAPTESRWTLPRCSTPSKRASQGSAPGTHPQSPSPTLPPDAEPCLQLAEEATHLNAIGTKT